MRGEVRSTTPGPAVSDTGKTSPKKRYNAWHSRNSDSQTPHILPLRIATSSLGQATPGRHRSAAAPSARDNPATAGCLQLPRPMTLEHRRVSTLPRAMNLLSLPLRVCIQSPCASSRTAFPPFPLLRRAKTVPSSDTKSHAHECHNSPVPP
jgi:hypothetical protein